MAISSVRFSRRLGRTLVLAGFIAGNVVTPALAGPSGGRIIAGQGAISQSGPNSTINQGSDRLIIEWQTFDTSVGESVRFNQPSSSASVLNRIISGNATIFDGSLFANGNVVIVNGSGIHFGPNSRIDVGSLIASTADISNSNFLNNRLIFDRPGQPDASITNAGTITVRDTGLAALVAPGVENSGLIQANLGTVILAAGEAHTIDFNGDGLMSFTVTKPTKAKPKDRNGKTLDALVSNKGEIRADGGTVLLTARQASRVLDNSINMSGVVRANSVGVRNGKIVLFGGKRGRVNVSGKIRARGKRRGQRGGRVHITGRKVAVPIAKIDVTGKAGGGEVLIGGAYKGGKLAGDSSIGYLQSGDLVSILTGTNAGAAGNGYIPTAEGVYVGKDAIIDVSATEAGNGGQAILWADGTTIFNGTIRARGGALSGDGGFVETSGAGRLGVGATASVDALAPNGRVGDWLLDPLSVTVATGGTASLAEIADAADVTNALTVDPTTLNTATANVSIVASDFITFTDAITMVNAGVGLTATATNAINVNATVATNNGDIAFRSDQINLNAGLNAGTGSVQFSRARVGGITVGADNANDLSFTTAEIGNITAGSLIFGAPIAGQNNVSQIQFLAGNFSAFSSVQYNALNSAASNIIGGGTQQYQSVELNANDGVIFNRITDITTSVGGATFNADADGANNSFDDFRVLGSRDGRIIPAVQVTSAADITINAQNYTEDTATGSTLSLSATGAVNFHRSTSGTMSIGDNATGGFSISTAQLGRINAGSANFGNIDAAANNSTAVSFGAAVAFGSVTANAATVSVNTNASITATDTIVFNAPTVELDGNLTATNGITGTATTVNVLGSTGGAEIQDAVDLAVAGATVNVAAGSYSSFIINKENLTVDGAGATTIVNAASPAITLTANGATVQDMLLQGTGTADDVGILLDGTTTPGLTGITITNVDFDNLDDGIRSQGNIGDGIAANVDVTIAGTSAADPAMFTDFLDAAIDVGDTNGDAVYSITDVIVADGADADTFSTGGPGFRFGAIGAVRVQRVTISGAFGDGIEFAAQTGATIDVLDSSITARDDGIDFLGLSGGTTTIARNTLLRGTRNTFGDGLEFTSITNGATVNIVGNTEISGRGDAIEFENGADASTITIAGNTTISGDTSDAIVILDPFVNSTVTIGSASATVDGVLTVFGGNSITGLGDDGISLQGVTGGSLTIRDNTLISGTDNGLDFINRAFTNAAISITGNTIQAVDHGIYKNNGVTGTTTFEILNNTIGTSTNRIGERGIFFDFGGIQDTATVTIGGTNQVFSTQQALYITDVHSSNALSITGGTYDGLSGALLVDNSGFGPAVTPAGQVVIGAAAFVGGSGSNVADIRTLSGRPLSVDFSGSATFDGGANGLFLSGAAIDILNDTFGTIAIGSTTAPTTNFIQLANGAEFLPGSPTVLDARTVLFGGSLASNLTAAQLFALEDQIVHFPDDNTLGLIDVSDLFVVQGESIQTAVNAAGLLGGARTVAVASGTFGGSVEVWVDDLTLVGRGATTIINTDAVDPNANNLDTDNGFQIAAISATAGGPANVTGVTIQDFSFDTLTTIGTNTGIVLGAATSAAIDSTLSGNIINDQNNGIFSRQSSGTTEFSDNTLTAIRNRGINFNDTVTPGESVTIVDNSVSSASWSLVFDERITGADVRISGNTLTSTAADGVHFAGPITAASTVTISGNDIEGADDGVDFAGAITTGSTINIQTNDRIEGLRTVVGDDGLGDGIAFGGAVSGALTNINVNNNTLIRGLDRGINFRSAGTGGPATITDASVTISGNTDITGTDIDGILFNANITNANITIGGANAADANSITGGDDGVDIENVAGGTFTIANNIQITGTTLNGIEFEGAVTGGAMINISSNAAINGLLNAVTFLSSVTDSSVLISGNTSIAGGVEGIQTAALSNSTFSVLQNETIMGTADAGILFGTFFGGPVSNGSIVEVAGNGTIRGGNDGVSFAFDVEDSSVTIAGNTQITGDVFDGVSFFGDILDSTITIGAATVSVNAVPTAFGGNTITGGENGIFHDFGTVIAGTSMVTYSDNDITGGFDAVHFDGIIESAAVNVIDNTNLTGQSFEGIFFQEEVENNATVTIARNSITGGDDGIEFDEQVRDDATVTIADNIIAGTGDGVEFEEEIEDNATVTISGNTITAANEQGVEINGLLDQSSLAVRDNTITGSENGIAFEAEITDTATSTISGNTITGGNGVAFNGFVDTTNAVQITGNTGITGTNGDGIVFNAPVTGTTVAIGTSTITGSEDGIDLAGMFAGTASATITGNTITGTGSEGVNTGDVGDAVAITIGNNTISGTTGIRLGSVTTTATNGVRIINNARISGTTQHGVHLDGPVTNAPITINGNTEIAGIDTGIKATDTITDAIVNLDGNTTISGGVNGVHFESLSGATINTANTDIIGGTNGFKAFGSTAAGATNRLNFTNSVLRGSLGAGLSVTTTAGGSGIDTNLGGGLTLAGLPSLALSGPNQTLVGNTLSDTRFVSVNGGNYIELSNGALFEPGRPTIINGNAAFFDGVQVPAGSLPPLVQSIENRIIDFDDNNTLGQIFFGPLEASDVVDVALLVSQFAQVIEAGIRISNPQTPGDLILRPDYPFDILFGDLLANLYPLGGCLPVFDDTGAVAGFSCIAPTHGSDISEFVDDYMAALNPAGP